MLRWVVACFIAGCSQGLLAEPQEQGDLSRFTFTEYHMGIDARIVVYAATSEIAENACEAAFKRIETLEAIMSDYRPDSELMRLCSKAGKGPVPVSPDLYRVLERAQTMARQSEGSFDITVGPLVQLWRKARKSGKLPEESDIEAAKKLVGWQKITLKADPRSASLETPGMRLDLGGIAKGYAADEALKELWKKGVKSALIEMGGDIVLGDSPPKSEGWSIKVPNASKSASEEGAEIYLKNCAISTSGDTEQYVVIDGIRYSHVVDPKTGRGLTRRTQASVIAENGFTTDPLSTALTIVDERHREELLRYYPRAKVFMKTAAP